MKLMLLIEMFAIALLGVPCSALLAGSVGAGEDHKDLKNPDLGSAFRSDTTLRFMRKLHQNTAVESQAEAEAARSQLCTQHGFKAPQRAGCVAFMRQACDGKDIVLKVSRESCLHFFQEEQPGYGSKSDKKGNEEDLVPDSLQQGPQHNSKSARKAVSEVDDDEPNGAAGLDAPDSLQHGPQYDSKKSQKATDKVTDNQKKAGAHGGVQDLNPFGHTVSDAFKDAQKGPNYDKKASANAKEEQNKPQAPTGLEEPEEHEEPEEKEPARDISSVPGCKNSPRDWTDSKNRDCEDYLEGEWCSRSGGYGDAWLDEWGTFEDVATKGKSAKQACCICGGGHHQDEEDDDLAREIASKKGLTGGAPAGAPSGPILGGKTGGELQEQGYSGELVAHEDQVTMTEDWGREFGPHSGHRDIKSICAEKPGNEWCSLHGYYDKERSSASMKSAVAVLATLLFACFR